MLVLWVRIFIKYLCEKFSNNVYGVIMKLKIILLVICSISSTHSNAFDTKMHVWVGQEIINDLGDDGDGVFQLSIPPFGDFDVDLKIATSILENQSVYLTGTIGPDGFPDLVAGQATVHPGAGTWRTDDWLKHLLINAKKSEEIAFVYGYIAHAATDTFAHSYVNLYSGDIFDMFDGEVDAEARHAVLEKYIASFLPPIKNNLGQNIGLPADIISANNSFPSEFVAQALIRNDDVYSQYSSTGMIHLQRMYDVEKIIIGTRAILDNIKDMDLPGSYGYNTVRELAELRAELSLVDEFIYKLVTTQYCESTIVGIILDDDCYDVTSTVPTLNEIWIDLSNEINSLESELNGLMLWASNMDSVLAEWLVNVQAATKEYVHYSAMASKAYLKSESPVEIIKEWLDCYGATYGGLPVELGELGCDVNFTWTNNYNPYKAIGLTAKDLVEKYPELKDIVAVRVSYDINKAVDEQITKFTDYIQDLVINYSPILHVTGFDEVLKHGKNLFASNGSLNDLIRFYQYEGIGALGFNKHLIKIDDIVERVHSDINLDNNGQFDPYEFNALYNAIIMTKLALLGVDQLNKLITHAGVSSFEHYIGAQLYNEEPYFNILFNSVGNIDGGFAWMGEAPRFVRSAGYDDSSSVYDRTFGYSEANMLDGFRLWVEPEVREKVFNKIFKGPIAPAIEYPSQIFLPELLPSYYTDRICAANQFPIDSSLQRCGSIMSWLLPSLFPILN